MAITEKPAWLVDAAAESAALLYLKNRAKDYWFEILPESKTLYFQYNACRNMPGQPFAGDLPLRSAVRIMTGAPMPASYARARDRNPFRHRGSPRACASRTGTRSRTG